MRGGEVTAPGLSKVTHDLAPWVEVCNHHAYTILACSLMWGTLHMRKKRRSTRCQASNRTCCVQPIHAGSISFIEPLCARYLFR